jgi:hypothetical protein
MTAPANIAPPVGKLPLRALRAAPETLEGWVQEIEFLRQRINTYAGLMCQVDNLDGTSTEAKVRAVRAFYERMLVVERQLGRIQEDLRLG